MGVTDTPTPVNIYVNFKYKIMKAKKAQKKALTPTMIMKSEKSKNYCYRLSNGDYLEFKNKDFPIVENNGQLSIF